MRIDPKHTQAPVKPSPQQNSISLRIAWHGPTSVSRSGEVIMRICQVVLASGAILDRTDPFLAPVDETINYFLTFQGKKELDVTREQQVRLELRVDGVRRVVSQPFSTIDCDLQKNSQGTVALHLEKFSITVPLENPRMLKSSSYGNIRIVSKLEGGKLHLKAGIAEKDSPLKLSAKGWAVCPVGFGLSSPFQNEVPAAGSFAPIVGQASLEPADVDVPHTKVRSRIVRDDKVHQSFEGFIDDILSSSGLGS